MFVDGLNAIILSSLTLLSQGILFVNVLQLYIACIQKKAFFCPLVFKRWFLSVHFLEIRLSNQELKLFMHR